MTKPMRSWMFVPGNKQRFLDKAASSDVDCVLLDLEDGVLPEDKGTARQMVAAVMGVDDFAPQRFVRINAVTTAWFAEDLEAIVVPGIEGICLPKAETPGHVEELARRLDQLEQKNGIEAGSVSIVAAIESPSALLLAPEIAKASPRVTGLIFGAEDYALDIGLGTNRQGEAAELIYARSAVVVAAAAARILSIDGVFPNLDDPVGMEADILQARRLGFSAKSTFNPRQVAEINRIFSPQPGEIEYARRVVKGFEEARSRGDASVAVGGQLVDLPIVMRAQRLLSLVEGEAK